jgi:hypothetical protein
MQRRERFLSSFLFVRNFLLPKHNFSMKASERVEEERKREREIEIEEGGEE